MNKGHQSGMYEGMNEQQGFDQMSAYAVRPPQQGFDQMTAYAVRPPQQAFDQMNAYAVRLPQQGFDQMNPYAVRAPQQQGFDQMNPYVVRAPQQQGFDQMNAYASGAPQQGENRFWDKMDPANPIGYIRDPHRLITYLIPFPRPTLTNVDPSTTPERFLIYTPPSPPLARPTEGVKEGKIHKVQRKWQGKVRVAKTGTGKTIKSKIWKGMSWAVDRTTTTNVDFLGRVADVKKQVPEGKHAQDGVVEGETTKQTVGVEELMLVYPSTMGLGPKQIREEFINSMLRTRTKAQREAIISTALLPISFAIDILATPVWPFGGLGEIDAVWAYTTIRGAKTARSVTKRLSSSDSEEKDGNIRLKFVQSERLEVMRAYLVAECNRQDSKLFPGLGEGMPTQEDMLRAIGWSPSEREQNWEDEQWEVTEVKSDLKNVMSKGAREWIRWCKAFEKNPEKAAKK